jgi:hypothetical protein
MLKISKAWSGAESMKKLNISKSLGGSFYACLVYIPPQKLSFGIFNHEKSKIITYPSGLIYFLHCLRILFMVSY